MSPAQQKLLSKITEVIKERDNLKEAVKQLIKLVDKLEVENEILTERLKVLE